MSPLHPRPLRGKLDVPYQQYGRSVLGAPLLWFPAPLGDPESGLILAGTPGDENAAIPPPPAPFPSPAAPARALARRPRVSLPRAARAGSPPPLPPPPLPQSLCPAHRRVPLRRRR